VLSPGRLAGGRALDFTCSLGKFLFIKSLLRYGYAAEGQLPLPDRLPNPANRRAIA
jgi:hypothetical protein